MHLQSLHIETQITDGKESGLAWRRFWYFTLQTFPVFKIGISEDLDPMVGFWVDSVKWHKMSI